MDMIEQLLENCKLLQALPSKLVETYYRDGTFFVRSYGKNELLHTEGDHCDQLEIIIGGLIAVERIDISGGLLTVTDFGSGKTIGANLLFSSHPYYPMTVTAKMETTVLIIKKALAFELCNEHPKFLLQFLEIISDHTVLLGTKIKQHVSRTIREGIITYLKMEHLVQKRNVIRLTLTKKHGRNPWASAVPRCRESCRR